MKRHTLTATIWILALGGIVSAQPGTVTVVPHYAAADDFHFAALAAIRERIPSTATTQTVAMIDEAAATLSANVAGRNLALLPDEKRAIQRLAIYRVGLAVREGASIPRGVEALFQTWRRAGVSRPVMAAACSGSLQTLVTEARLFGTAFVGTTADARQLQSALRNRRARYERRSAKADDSNAVAVIRMLSRTTPVPNLRAYYAEQLGAISGSDTNSRMAEAFLLAVTAELRAGATTATAVASVRATIMASPNAAAWESGGQVYATPYWNAALNRHGVLTGAAIEAICREHVRQAKNGWAPIVAAVDRWESTGAVALLELAQGAAAPYSKPASMLWLAKRRQVYGGTLTSWITSVEGSASVRTVARAACASGQNAGYYRARLLWAVGFSRDEVKEFLSFVTDLAGAGE